MPRKHVSRGTRHQRPGGTALVSDSHERLRERRSGLWSFLSYPRVYSMAQKILGAKQARAHVAERYIRAKSGDLVLDVGCGTADILDYLPDVDYLGIDLSEEYLTEGRRRFGHRRPRARFVRMDVRALFEGSERFDLVLALGLLHHFNDEQIGPLLKTVGGLMKPGARLVTIDPLTIPGQNLVARVLASIDRGRFVRSPKGYEGLARQVFSRVELHVRHDLIRLPYTHLLMECSEPIR